ncbi:hypothetical protein BS47DRAFT_330588 [Hydnum rufescens UP504]|uniref:FAD/NAD(P)-binding domain-containing protein n=1 Tax=Hydnum rufescens UP504 TaxID=1448309 RepID=A0A9P6B5X8_9AGAM|nr:hypothetical protein BS47DRAFT_330588 [Hydnum rufescens UP504]
MFPMAKTKIVVIGGGSGASLVHNLLSSIDASKHTLTLISPHPYSVFMVATARMTVTSEGSLEDSALLPYDGLTKRGVKFVQGRVSRVFDGVVNLESGDNVKYDYLVVATGSSWEGPINFPDGDVRVKEHISRWREKFASASRVVVIGGGSVGTELASEVKHHYPNSSVTIVHASNFLLNDTYPARFRKSLTARVQKHGVKLVLGDRLTAPAEGERRATTTNGLTLEADLFITCRGGHPNTSILKTLDPSILTPSGHVKVLPTLQIPLNNGKTNVYAMGDIIDWKEQHMFTKAKAHKVVITKNIVAQLNGSNPPAKYKGYMEAIAVTIGPNAGRSYMPVLFGIVLGDWVTKSLKSAGLLVAQGRQWIGL